MALFDTLKQILTPYANKINQHTEEIDDLDERVTDLEAGGGGGSGGSSTLAGLTDTNISNKLDGQILVYDDTSNKWKNRTPDFTDGTFIVTISGTGSYRTCDKTYDEIYIALSSGKNVVAVDGTGVAYPYAGVMSQNGVVCIALGISVVYNKTATLTGYLIAKMESNTIAIRQDQNYSFYSTDETYTKSDIDSRIGNIETLLASI